MPIDISGHIISDSSITNDGFNKSIIQDGLVLHLDAGNKNSYSGTGTIWTDLSYVGNNGTLTNGPTYSSSGGGSFIFDGVNDYVVSSNETALDTQTPSVEVWIKTNALSQNGFWFEKGAVNTQYSLFQEGSVIQWRHRLTDGTLSSLSTTTANFINTTDWYQIVGTFVSGTRRLYINGDLVNSDTLSGTISTNTGGQWIGIFGGAGGYPYDGLLSVCRVYNRALHRGEILANYYATKDRF